MRTFKLFATAIFATMSLAACNEIETPNECLLSEDNLPSLSISHQFLVGSDSVDGIFEIINPEFRFGSYSEHNSAVSTSDNNNVIYYSIPENKDVNGKRAYTRDMEFYINIIARNGSWGSFKFGDYGVFNHPVHIRQLGESGTIYFNGKDYQELVSNDGRWTSEFSGYCYIKGSVESVSEIYDSPKNVVLRNGEQLAKDIACFDMVIRTDDGVSVKIRVNELAKDDILKNLKASLTVGTIVESGLYRACYDKSFGGLVDVTALEVFKK